LKTGKDRRIEQALIFSAYFKWNLAGILYNPRAGSGVSCREDADALSVKGFNGQIGRSSKR